MRPANRVFCFVSLLLTTLSIASAAFLPQGLSFLWPSLQGFDFYNYDDRLHFLHSGAFLYQPGYPWYYPPAGVIPYELFHLLTVRFGHEASYLTFVVMGIAGALWLAACFCFVLWTQVSSLKEGAVLAGVAALTAWPILFSLQRGNFESLLWLTLAAAIWAIASEKPTQGAVLLGVVGAVKIYPLLCLALFIRDRRWKQIATGLGVAAIVTLASVWLISPTMPFRALFHATKSWTAAYALVGWQDQARFDHSAFELIKAVFSSVSEGRLLSVYLPAAAVLATAVFFLRVRHLPLVNQVLFLVTLCVLLPPASFDYTLQNLYIPFAWVAVLVVREQCRIDTTLMALFAVALAPISFVQVAGVYWGGPIKCLALLGLIWISTVDDASKDPSRGVATVLKQRNGQRRRGVHPTC